MAPPIRRKANATRARIADAALDLFANQGFAETTIDQIASAARVSPRTVFRHFESKEAILFDHLVVRRDAAIDLLRDRPTDEPVLISLHTVLRELCMQGYERRLLAQIKDVLAVHPGLAQAVLGAGIRGFASKIVATIQSRSGGQLSLLEINALSCMARSWLEAATTSYLVESDRSLVECFDETVDFCLHTAAADIGWAPASKKAKR